MVLQVSFCFACKVTTKYFLLSFEEKEQKYDLRETKTACTQNLIVRPAGNFLFRCVMFCRVGRGVRGVGPESRSAAVRRRCETHIAKTWTACSGGQHSQVDEVLGENEAVRRSAVPMLFVQLFVACDG